MQASVGIKHCCEMTGRISCCVPFGFCAQRVESKQAKEYACCHLVATPFHHPLQPGTAKANWMVISAVYKDANLKGPVGNFNYLLHYLHYISSHHRITCPIHLVECLLILAPIAVRYACNFERVMLISRHVACESELVIDGVMLQGSLIRRIDRISLQDVHHAVELSLNVS